MIFTLRRKWSPRGSEPCEESVSVETENAGRNRLRASIEATPLRPGELIELIRTAPTEEVDIVLRHEYPQGGSC